MTPPENLSRAEARNILLTAQGLAQATERDAAKDDVLHTIRRMKALQIDSINVVARSPYLVLWSRLGNYNPAWLGELLEEGSLFEYWAHAMCFLPVEDYPLFRRFMLDGLRSWKQAAGWVQKHPEVVEQVLSRIRQEGGLRAADFVSDHKPSGGWWNWKEEKLALEYLFILGELMISHRDKFQRVYDLRSRVLPAWEDGPGLENVPPREEVLQTLTLKTMEALGVALADWVPDYFRLPKTGNLARLEALVNAGLLRRVEIEGFSKPAYLHPSAAPAQPAGLTSLLSPFDPLVWDRKRLKDLFDFDYTIEVYTPAAKRSFGYYTLPILHRDRLVGRLDPKAHRAEGLFEVKALALEPGIAPTEDLVEGLSAALHSLAAWHGTPEVVIRRTTPDDLGPRFVARL